MTTDVVIIIAMESERIHLDTLLPGWEVIDHPVWQTRKHGCIVTITCGVGLINAAAATEYAISTFQPQLVLNYGCAGAHVRDIYPGDVVIGQTVVHHGRMIFSPNGDIVPLGFGFTVPGDDEKSRQVKSDAALVERAHAGASSVAIPDWPRELHVEGQPERAPEVRIGTVSSGDIWLQHPELIDAGHGRTESLCEDMEAVAVGQIAAMHRLPFLTVKDISNSEFHEATVFDSDADALPTAQVGLRAAIVIAGLLTDLGYS
ncbi:MAG: 5'-methylthioadenosine/S-adenosylhomocysteine nucleosidase [Thermomicrobiales bacterium]|nr:5'-methylthioadenosine/S-adenosylhomocysteine nucleosidase [Thermomicrobiales bacterium]